MRRPSRPIFPRLCCAALLIAATAAQLAAQSRADQPVLSTCIEEPVYSGSCRSSNHDGCQCGDARTWTQSLADSGVVYDIDAVQFYQGTAAGGIEQNFKYGAHNDYVFNFDLAKFGLWEGLSLKLRGENRYGRTVNDDTGAIFSVAVLPDLPKEDDTNLALTNVLFTQTVSESLSLFAGKLDTLDGDENEFAHGRGKDQFFNVAFVTTPLAFRGVPYATLGAGFIIYREGEPILTFNVLNPIDTATTSGFRELFREGITLNPELRLPVEMFGQPGHQMIGAVWSSREFTSLDQDPRLILDPTIGIAATRGTWALYWNFDHYLVSDPRDPERGWGVFGRAGIADQHSNVLQWFLSAGVGGSSPIASRPQDTFGIGWYNAAPSSSIGPLIDLGYGQGVEMFYNFGVGRRFRITPDFQIILPARTGIHTALVPGVRAKLDF